MNIPSINPRPLKIHQFHDFQQVRAKDLQALENNARNALSTLVLLMTSAATGKMFGLKSVKDGLLIRVGHGVGFTAVNQTDPSTGRQETVLGYAQLSSEYVVDDFQNHPLRSGQMRREDVLVLSPMLVDDPPEPIQVLNTQSPSGRPEVETHDLVMSRTISGRVTWMEAASDGTVSLGPYDIPITKVIVAGTGFSLQDIEYRPNTVAEHKYAAELDHPPGCVKAYHIASEVIGPSYVAGTDLSLQECSNDIIEARGNVGSINARIEEIIDESGNLKNDAVDDAIERIHSRVLGTFLDEKGNISPEALLQTGAITKIGVISGSTSGGSATSSTGWIPLPPGFTEDECHFLVSPRNLSFAIITGSQVQIDCYSEGRRPHCIVTVNTPTADNPVAVYYGTVNYIVIGVKTRL